MVPVVGMDGGAELLVVIKETFSILPDGRVRRVGGTPIRIVDLPWDEDDDGSTTKLPSDIGGVRPGTDVLVVGSAVARGGKEFESLDVLVAVGPIERFLRVFGPRAWYKGATGYNLSSPAPCEGVPLRWELAFGGFDAGDGEERPLFDMRNPVGRGLVRKSSSLLHAAGPQIEDPRDLVKSHRSRPAPAGVAPIGPHWEPRSRFAGTYDEAYMRERLPLPPLDFDIRFNQIAPAEMITPSPLRGGEPVRLHNLCEAGPLQFELPRLHPYVGARIDRRMVEHRAVLDTLLLRPNERTFEMVWRARVPRPRPARRLDMVQVHEKAVLR